MLKLTLTADLTSLADLELLAERFIGRATGRVLRGGEAALKAEAPRKTGSYAAMISGQVTGFGIVEIGAPMYPGTPARSAVAVSAKGKLKRIQIDATESVDLTSILINGRPVVRPVKKKALIIPVDSPPPGEAYVISGGKYYLLRRRSKATKPNRFDIRAEQRFLLGLDSLLLDVPVE